MNHDLAISRKRMVETQIKARGITDPKVLEVMEQIPRHLFAQHSRACDDTPLPIPCGQTISQPYVVALMTQALQLKGSENVLEIGTGSGYQTAILAKLAKWVYSVERIAPLFYQAQQALEAARIFNINLAIRDGSKGWPEEAPFNAILVAAASPKIPQPLFEQLAEGGRLVIPVGDPHTQQLLLVTKEHGQLVEQGLGGVRFVRLVGAHGWSA